MFVVSQLTHRLNHAAHLWRELGEFMIQYRICSYDARIYTEFGCKKAQQFKRHEAANLSGFETFIVTVTIKRAH